MKFTRLLPILLGLSLAAPSLAASLTPVPQVTKGQLTTGLTAKQDTLTFVNVKSSFGAKGDGVQVTDGAITSGTAALASTSATFTAADVGKVVAVKGAGASAADLVSTVSAFTDSHHVTLAATAGTTVSAARVTYGTDDRAALNNALAAGGRDFLPAGMYVVSAGLTISQDNTTLEGVAPPAAQAYGGTNCAVIMSTATSGDLLTIGKGVDATTVPYINKVIVRSLGLRRAVDCAAPGSPNATAIQNAAIHAVAPNNCDFLDLVIDYAGGGRQWDGIDLTSGPLIEHVTRCLLYGVPQSALSHSGATVSGYTGAGIRLWGWSTATRPGSDIFLSGGNEVVQWGEALRVAGNVGGLTIDHTSLEISNIGVHLTTDTIGGTALPPNREVELNQSSWVDANFTQGVVADAGSFYALKCTSAWFCGNGEYVDGSYISAWPGGAGVNISSGQFGPAQFTGCKLYSNGGSALLMACNNWLVSGCTITGNGVGTNGANGAVYGGNVNNFVVTGNLITGTVAGSQSGAGVQLVGANNHYLVTANVITGNAATINDGSTGNTASSTTGNVF